MSKRTLVIVLLAAVWAAACGEERGNQDAAKAFRRPFTDAKVYPVPVSSELVVGENRLMMALRDAQDRTVGSPTTDVSARFFDLSRSATRPVFSREMQFVWMIKPYQGVYVTSAEFPSAGEWGIAVRIKGGGLDEVARTTLTVKRDGTSPGVGERVPASQTPTSKDKKMSLLTTDDDPAARFYRTSIHEAVAAREPFVVVFATPKFCTSRVCGPVLDLVKGVARDFPRMTFIHVEVYELPTDPANLRAVPAMGEWGLRTEPWVFVVDDRGRVASKYEGTLSPGELRAELKNL